MRRFFIITFFLTVVASTFIYLHHRDNVIPIANLLQQKINGAHMKTYHDSTFGYIMRYPDFFVQLPDSLDTEPGCCTFRFWNVEQINLSGYVLGNPEQLTVQQMKDSLVHENHDVKIRTLADTLIISSPLYAEDGVVDGYRSYAKYVRHRKLWFVQSLSYPVECEDAVRRIKHQIDSWTVWENVIPQKCFIPKRRRQTFMYSHKSYS